MSSFIDLSCKHNNFMQEATVYFHFHSSRHKQWTCQVNNSHLSELEENENITHFDFFQQMNFKDSYGCYFLIVMSCILVPWNVSFFVYYYQQEKTPPQPDLQCYQCYFGLKNIAALMPHVDFISCSVHKNDVHCSRQFVRERSSITSSGFSHQLRITGLSLLL